MKWIGQHIWDFISRFRSDVYLEATETGTIASGGNLGLDSNNKIVKASTVSSVVVTDNNENTYFPIVFHDESNNLLDDTGAFTYSPGLGTLSLTNNAFTSFYLTNSANSVTDPHFEFYNSKGGAVGEDNDDCGTIMFYGNNNAGAVEKMPYGSIRTSIEERDDGDEAGTMRIGVATSDDSTSVVRDALKATGHATANTVNIDLGYGATSLTTIAGDLDIDGDNMTSAGAMTFTPGGLFKTVASGVEIENGSTTGAPALTIDNDDTDQVALYIDAENIDNHVVSISAENLTTAGGISMNFDSLTTGIPLYIDWDDALTTDINRNTGGAILVDYNKSGNIASGQTVNVKGTQINMSDDATGNVGTMRMTGLDINLDSAGTGGSNVNTGLLMHVIDGNSNIGLDLTCEDGAGSDIILRSSADSGDYCAISTLNHGATKITTIDDDAIAADITLDADGEIILDAADPYLRFYNNGTEMAHFSYHHNNTFLQLKEDGGSGSDYFYIATGEHAETEIATFDGAGSSGNLKFSIDGTISCESTDNLMNLGYDDDTSFTLRRTRHSDGNAGPLKIRAGDAVDGQTNRDGGDLYLYGGLQTGSGANGSIFFYGSVGGGGSGTSLAGEKLISKMNVDALMSTTQFWYTSGSTTDYFRVSVGANGATTLATTDGAGTTDANLTVNVDGDIELNADGGTISFKDDTTTLGSLGAAALIINGNASDAASIVLGERTTNGTNVCKILAPTSCDDHTLTSPGETGTIALNNKTMSFITCSFYDTLGTTLHYIPLGDSTSEVTSEGNTLSDWIAPCETTVKCVIIRMSNITSSQDVTLTVWKDPVGSGTKSSVEAETLTVDASGENDVHYWAFDSATIAKGEVMKISIQAASAMSSNTQFHAKVVLELNWDDQYTGSSQIFTS